MKKFNRLWRAVLLTLLFLISSVGIAYSQTPTLKNTPVNTSPAPRGQSYLTGTTFSIANDDAETGKNYFNLSEIVFGRPLATIEMGSSFQEANGEWNNGGSVGAPRFTILSNPALLDPSYKEKTDGINRLIFRAPKQNETIFKVTVNGYKPRTPFLFKFTIEEIADGGFSEYTIFVNGEKITNSQVSLGTKGKKTISASSDKLTSSQLNIELKRTNSEGDDVVITISDLYIYGEIDALNISASETSIGLGASVALTAVSGLGVDLDAIKWEKNINNAGFVPFTDDSGSQLTGATVSDKPEAGETCYRAVALMEGSEIYSNEVCVTSSYKCATNSAQHNLFIEDFGTLSLETARSSGPVGYIKTEIYKFVDGCEPLEAEGTYAIMTNPRYAGCDSPQGSSHCNCDPEKNRLWFRDLYDHTSGGLKNGEWGAMLMVNAANLQGQSEQLVYSRTVDMPCTNTNMIFSAWFANASQANAAKISMKFVVRDENGNKISSAELPVNNIDFNSGWIKGETSFNSGENKKLTVEIYNCSSGGQGNDFMVDDISFSICVPEISLSVSSTVPEVQVKDDQVSGSCGSAINLDLEEGMAEVVFDNPYYLWYVKEQGSNLFVHKEELNNKTSLDTLITPYTQYYVVATANEDDATDYINGNLSKCSPVAISNIITVLCAPNLEVAVIERNCNDITLEARKHDDPSDLIDFWWQISKDGKNWSTLNVPKNTYNLEYTITSDSYIRIYTDMVASVPVKVPLRGISLTSQPAKTYIGSSVKLTAATIKYELEDDDKYQWFEKDLTTGTSDYSPLEETTNSFIYYTLQSDKASIKVEADGCEAEVTIEKLMPIEIQEKSRDCNEITIEATTEVEPSKIKWYYSADGVEYTEYSKVGTPIVFDVPEEYTDGVYVKGKTTDGKESEPIKVYPIIVKNTVYNALNEVLVQDLLVSDKEQITIKTEVSGIEISASDVVIYKSCTGNILASNSEAEYTTSITKENKCFVTEYKGCVSENIEFSIKPQELIWPTAFNPLNNDGVNDTFMQGYGIKMLIIDRYGNVVSESEDGWDGTIKGANAMPGVYFYVATLPDETVKKGTIELVHYVK